MILTRNLLALAAAAALAACGQSQPSVSLDFSSLVSAAASQQHALPIDELLVHFATPTFDVTEQVAFDSPVVTLTVPSGPLYIEATARGDMGTGLVPTYYGDQRLSLQPGETRDVVINMFPAGAIDVTVLISAERLAQISVALVYFDAIAPRTDQSTEFTTKFANSQVARVLPSGVYTYHAMLSFDGGQSFQSEGPTSNQITINPGEVLTAQLDLTGI
jgi:hypothetical protein